MGACFFILVGQSWIGCPNGYMFFYSCEAIVDRVPKWVHVFYSCEAIVVWVPKWVHVFLFLCTKRRSRSGCYCLKSIVAKDLEGLDAQSIHSSGSSRRTSYKSAAWIVRRPAYAAWRPASRIVVVMCSSTASCSASNARSWKRRPPRYLTASSRDSSWIARFGIRRLVLFWYFLISRAAIVALLKRYLRNAFVCQALFCAILPRSITDTAERLVLARSLGRFFNRLFSLCHFSCRRLVHTHGRNCCKHSFYIIAASKTGIFA